MAKKLVITEAQYKSLLKEGVQIKADPQNGDIKGAYEKAKTDAQKSGLKPEDTEIVFEPTNESKVIKVGDLKKSRLKALKENSQVYTVKDFMNKLMN